MMHILKNIATHWFCLACGVFVSEKNRFVRLNSCFCEVFWALRGSNIRGDVFTDNFLRENDHNSLRIAGLDAAIFHPLNLQYRQSRLMKEIVKCASQ